MHLVKDRLELPVLDANGVIVGGKKKLPGDTISKAEWKAAGQSDQDIAALVALGDVEVKS